MSDRDLRKILSDVIDEIDQGRLRPLPPARLRNRVGGAVLAAALGLGLAGCQGRVVGTVTDAGTPPPDATQIFHPDATPELDAATDPDPDAAPTPDAAPEPDAGTVLTLDGGIVNMYLAMGFDDASITAIDAGDTPTVDADLDVDIEVPAYMAPFPEDD